MAFNLELVERALKQIEAFPEEWDQNDWRTQNRCGTAYCFAGHVAMLAGASWASAVLDDVVTPDGRIMLVSDYAAEMLGIKGWDRELRDVDFFYQQLFYCPTDLPELKRRVAAAAKELGTQ